jgi:hypothetical protein
MTQMGERRLGGQLGTVSDFWLWAFGDLRSNCVRGFFAEWMVAQILGLEPNPSGSWDNYDLQLRDGRTVEVKAGAYLQAWHTGGSPPSKVQFTGLKASKWLDGGHKRSNEEKTFNADLYVFCVHTERNAERWDAFDLAQWDFYIVPRAQLQARDAACLHLSSVQKLAQKITAEELVVALLGASS